MTGHDFDLFVIGGGSGGVRAARLAAEAGAKVALAEMAALGGTCVNAGCIPKKLLSYAAGFADEFADAAGFGWDAVRPAFDWARLIEAKDAEVRRLNGAYERVLRTAGVEIFAARAAIAGPRQVTVGGRTLSCRHVLIATGGAPRLLAIPGAELAITSDDAFHLKALPGRILIVGGGYVAVEFACIFAGLGVEVALATRGPALLPGFDRELTQDLAAALTARGIALRFGVEVTRIEPRGDSLAASLRAGDPYLVDQVMLAVGREPRSAGLGLELVGLPAAGAVAVDAHFATRLPWLHALGDVIDRVRLTPVALAEAGALVATLFGGRPTELDYTLVPSAVFSHPPLAGVGLTEQAAAARGLAHSIYAAAFRPLKARLSGRPTETKVKLIVADDSDRVLGAHMLGPDAPEIVQGLGVALGAGATKAQFDRTLGIHPTAAEEFVTLRRRRPPRPDSGGTGQVLRDAPE